MTRGKVNLAYIKNDATRRATFKKRKAGLITKVHQLSTLCDVDACAIIFNPYENEPDVWPSPLDAQRVIARFRRMPEQAQSSKMANPESFTRQMLAKAEDQLMNQQKGNHLKELTGVMFGCLRGSGFHHLSLVNLKEVDWLLNQSTSDIGSRVEFLKKNNLPQGSNDE